MIIDLILNRKDGQGYRPEKFYRDVRNYGGIGNNILDAMDNGDEKDVKIALCEYVVKNGYNKNINYFIINNDWLNTIDESKADIIIRETHKKIHAMNPTQLNKYKLGI